MEVLERALSYADDVEIRKALRKPFSKEQIGHMPKGGIQIAFVGHAAVTDRLNKAAPDWTYTIDEMFTHEGACWVRGTMNIGGVSRPEYGDGKNPKEAIGNFLRRGAMRFGVAVDLWSREELEDSTDVEPVVGGPEGSADRSHPADGEAEVDGGAPAPPSREGVGAEGEAAPAPHEPRLLSSQRNQLLRHAVALRWDDNDISAAVAEAYPGLSELSELSQEQARALITEWAKLVKATRPTKEQKDRLRSLATPSDAVRRAQVMFGADHIKNIGDLTLAEAAALIADLEAIREEQSA